MQLRKDITAAATLLALIFTLAPGVAQLGLLSDDYAWLAPVRAQTMTQYLAEYRQQFGFFRPLAIYYYFQLYSLYMHDPWAAHLLPLALQGLGGWMAYWLLDRIGTALALPLSCLLVVCPFFTEQYGWLAASHSVIINLILLGQLAIIWLGSGGVRALGLVAALQCVSLGLVETTLFTIIPLAGLAIWRARQSRRAAALGWAGLILPSLGYVLFRQLIFPPEATPQRELQLLSIPLTMWASIIYANLLALFGNLSYLFVGGATWRNFWLEMSSRGARASLAAPLMLPLLLCATGLLAAAWADMRTGGRLAREPLRGSPLIWALLALAAILPSLFLVQPHFPFRVMALPVWLAAVAAVHHKPATVPTMRYGLLTGVVLVCVLVSLGVLHAMGQQARDDRALLARLAAVVTAEHTGAPVVAAEEHPFSTQTRWEYYEFLRSCGTTDWCIHAGLTGVLPATSSIEVIPEVSKRAYTLVYLPNAGLRQP